MIKPKMAEGSRVDGRKVIDSDGNSCVAWRIYHDEPMRVHAFSDVDCRDILRALYEAGQFELWEACVALRKHDRIPATDPDSSREWLQMLDSLLNNLFAIVDKMAEKEQRP